MRNRIYYKQLMSIMAGNESGVQRPPQEALRKWLDTLPLEEADVDPRLKKRIPVELHLHQLTVEGFDYLAKKQGMKSGKQLMYMVLSQYLSNNLPEDF